MTSYLLSVLAVGGGNQDQLSPIQLLGPKIIEQRLTIGQPGRVRPDPIGDPLLEAGLTPEELEQQQKGIQQVLLDQGQHCLDEEVGTHQGDVETDAEGVARPGCGRCGRRCRHGMYVLNQRNFEPPSTPFQPIVHLQGSLR